MNNSENIVFNQVDFVIKSPSFKIIFSYMDERGIPFVREFALRLLKLNSCKPKDFADYFDFTQREAEIAIKDLTDKRWAEWKEDGSIGLSIKGRLLFDQNSKGPKIPSLQQRSQRLHLELLDKNFIPKERTSRDNRNALELGVLNKDLSESKDVAKRQFQIDFINLKEDKVIENLSRDVELYKIDLIEKLHDDFFRFIQPFEINAEDGSQLERSDLKLTRSDNVQQTITEVLDQYKPSLNNLPEIMQSMESLKDTETLKIVVGGKLDFHKLLDLELNSNNETYFVGQIYHQNKIIDQIARLSSKLETTKKLTWIAPSDFYWGKQTKLIEMISSVSNGAMVKRNKEKVRLYNFKTYLPLPEESRSLRNEVCDLKHQFKEVPQDNLYGFSEGFLKGNTEVIVLEDTLAVVCYHVQLPDQYDVTLPVGFMTTDIEQVNHIATVTQSYLNSPVFDDDSKFDSYDFGSFKNL